MLCYPGEVCYFCCMRIIENRFIPFKGFLAVNLFGLVFVRRGTVLYPWDLQHEEIHSRQQRELLYVFFFIIYFLEWLFNLVFHRKSAYRRISFEREAFKFAHTGGYLANRPRYAMWRRGFMA